MGIYTGGSAVDVDNYEIEWDAGNGGTWASLTTLPATETSFTQSALTGGVTYGYRIRAINEYGSAAVLSEPTYMLTAQEPAKMSPPILSIEDLYVKISWSTPFANYEPILEYRVLLEDS